jgi:IS30 family transposase
LREVSRRLEQLWSPQEISRRLLLDFPGDREMRVSHETIYQSLFVQGRGELRRELARCLRSGRTVRHPRGQADRRGRLPGMVMISERPAEADDRAVPGHWEGDIILGAGGRSAVGTLVERTSRFLFLLHLQGDRSAAAVNAAMRKAITNLPRELWRSITWDQGAEMASHIGFTIATGIPVYFCDPHAPWQRGSNENTYWRRMSGAGASSTGDAPAQGRWVTRRTRAEKLSVDMSTAARRARALTGSDLIEAC